MPELPPLLPARPVFRKVGQNLYRLEPSGTYYALLKRAGKQIRRSLKITDPAPALLNPGKSAGKTTFADLTLL